jgi:DNA-binding MarR family transcriptional regulator
VADRRDKHLVLLQKGENLIRNSNSELDVYKMDSNIGMAINIKWKKQQLMAFFIKIRWWVGQNIFEQKPRLRLKYT